MYFCQICLRPYFGEKNKNAVIKGMEFLVKFQKKNTLRLSSLLPQYALHNFPLSCFFSSNVLLQRFHFGGDEVPESAWMNSPACRYLSGKGLGFSMTFYFIERLTEITDSLGIDIAAWEDGFKEGGRSTLPLQNSPQKLVSARKDLL